MTTPGLILREILHRKTNFLLSVLAVTAAVALFISFFTAGAASERETARLMLQMGYNLHIVPEGTDRSEFLLTGLTDKTMPQQYLEKLAIPKAFSYNHLLGTLQRRISWQGLELVLTGLAPEVCPPGAKKPPMVEPINPAAVTSQQMESGMIHNSRSMPDAAIKAARRIIWRM